MPDTLLEQIEADLDSLYDATFGFAETCTGPSGDFLGVFSHEYYQADTGGPVLTSSALPVLRTRAVDSLGQGDAVTVRGNGYTVAEVKPDGYGEVLHRLRAA